MNGRQAKRCCDRDANAAQTFLRAGRAPRAGEVFRNPHLGWTYREISDGGSDAFYRGAVARRLLDCSAAHGGTIAAADLAEYTAEDVNPISTRYRGWDVYELPPNGQGIAALMMLNMLEQFPVHAYGHNSVEALHALIETKKLAYADLIRHVSDPRFAELPVAGMLSKVYARDRATLIDLDRANPECLRAPFRPTPATRPISAWLIGTATWCRSSKASSDPSDRVWCQKELASRYKAAAGSSRWIRPIRTRWRLGSGLCTPSFRAS